MFLLMYRYFSLFILLLTTFSWSLPPRLFFFTDECEFLPLFRCQNKSCWICSTSGEHILQTVVVFSNWHWNYASIPHALFATGFFPGAFSHSFPKSHSCTVMSCVSVWMSCVLQQTNRALTENKGWENKASASESLSHLLFSSHVHSIIIIFSEISLFSHSLSLTLILLLLVCSAQTQPVKQQIRNWVKVLFIIIVLILILILILCSSSCDWPVVRHSLIDWVWEEDQQWLKRFSVIISCSVLCVSVSSNHFCVRM